MPHLGAPLELNEGQGNDRLERLPDPDELTESYEEFVESLEETD